jgi:hypothetical protein
LAAVPWLLRFGQDLGPSTMRRLCRSQRARPFGRVGAAGVSLVHTRQGGLCAAFQGCAACSVVAACLQCPTAELSRVCRNVHDCADASQFALMSPREA